MFCLFGVKESDINLPILSALIFWILPWKLSLKSIATPADWCVGPELLKDNTGHSFCHCILVVLVECVSCSRVISGFFLFLEG